MAAYPFVRTPSLPDSCANQNGQPLVSHKTWQDLLEYLEILPVELPRDADGATTLRLLRERYGNKFQEMQDPFLDEIVDRFSKTNHGRQLAALGSALQKLELALYRLKFNDHIFPNTVCVGRKDDDARRKEHWNAVTPWFLSFRRSFRLIQLDRNNTLESASDPTGIPMSFTELGGEATTRWTNYRLIEHFLVIPYNDYQMDCDKPTQHVRVYDLRYLPIREVQSVKITYNSLNIVPYTLEFETEYGEKFCYVASVGGFFNMLEDIYKTTKNDKGETVPVFMKDSRKLFEDIPCPMGEKQPKDIPEIEEA